MEQIRRFYVFLVEFFSECSLAGGKRTTARTPSAVLEMTQEAPCFLRIICTR